MRDARGSVVPFAAAGMVTLVLTALVVSVISGALVTQRQTQSAADLAALAAATAVQHGTDGCAAADRVATVNNATLVDCTVEGAAVRVRVARVAPRMFGRELLVRAVARAGPR